MAHTAFHHMVKRTAFLRDEAVNGLRLRDLRAIDLGMERDTATSTSIPIHVRWDLATNRCLFVARKYFSRAHTAARVAKSRPRPNTNLEERQAAHVNIVLSGSLGSIGLL